MDFAKATILLLALTEGHPTREEHEVSEVKVMSKAQAMREPRWKP